MFLPKNDAFRSIKLLIMLYGLLLIAEGALRKWVVPGLSNPLLLVRDPIALLIYALAFQRKAFPTNAFLFNAIVLAVLSFLFSLFSEQSNILITIYGIKINYFHLPMIFIIGQVFTRTDVYNIGKLFLLISIPMSLLVVMQFYSPRNHFLNLSPGGIVDLGITGAEGKFRPSGTFSFITGLAAFYPIVTALYLGALIQKQTTNTLLNIAIGASIILVIPFSISRLLALSCAIVLGSSLIALYYSKEASRNLTRLIAMVTIVTFSATFLPFFDEGANVFEARWTLATGEGVEGFQKNILERALAGFTGAFDIMEYAPLTGEGVGIGSNVAAKMLTGKTGFLLAENEWQRIILELGPLLGLAFIAYRILLTVFIGKAAWDAAKAGNALPILLFFATFLLLLNGQWAPPTTLGFTVFSAGLTLAACNGFNENAIQKSRRRMLANNFMKPSIHRLTQKNPMRFIKKAIPFKSKKP